VLAMIKKVKSGATKDPQMPTVVKKMIEGFMDDITPDIQVILSFHPSTLL